MTHAQSDSQRPASAVSDGCGIAGLLGLGAWLVLARLQDFSGPNAAMVGVLACGIPMVLWSLLIDRVHRNPTTGIDWSRPPRPLGETFDISMIKIAGLWITWTVIGIFYCLGRWYWTGQYAYAMQFMGFSVPVLLVASVPYVLWLDRRLAEPRDASYAFGRMVLGLGGADRAMIADHARNWTVKGFFSAFMISIVPGNYADVVGPVARDILANPVALAYWLVSLLFLIDVAFATVGYILTMRPLDAHIRNANPYVAGWTAALMCYPPFVLMADNGPLDYHPGTADWSYWLNGHPVLLVLMGIVLVTLTGIYAWATVAFGLRFSNLTNRGVITHGPYRWSRHPAYLAKNLFWWLYSLPFFATAGGIVEIVRNCAILAAVNGVYYWRARTEERHLLSEPAYRAYYDWSERHAPVPRFFRWLRGNRNEPVPAEA